MSLASRLPRLAGFVLLQVVIVVVLLEVVARLFNPIGISYFPENARYNVTFIREELIGYRNQPGLDGEFYGVPVRINSLGLRDREVADKVPGEFRILAMGDSVPFGIGVRYEDSYPYQLEVLLNEHHAGRRFRILNMGVPSYNTEQELIQLKTLGLTLRPDAVTLFFSSNDIEPKLWSLNKQKEWYSYLLRRSYAGSLLTLAFQKARARMTGGSSRKDPNARNTSQVALDQYRLDSPRWQAIDQSLTEIQAILRARRIPFVLFASLKQPYIIEMLEGVARREGITFVNLPQNKDDPRWAGQDERRFRNSVVDGHPSPLGNQVLATLMAENLERHKMLGKR